MQKRNGGALELVVLGLLAALVVVLAIPLFSGIPEMIQAEEGRESSVPADSTAPAAQTRP